MGGFVQCCSTTTRRWLLQQAAAGAGKKKSPTGSAFGASRFFVGSGNVGVQPGKNAHDVRSNSSVTSTSTSSSATSSSSSVEKDNNATTNFVPLQHVPSLPFVGSLIPQHSGIAMELEGDATKVWVECRRRFGDFYTIGIPGIGAGLHGTLYMVQDPHEMAKVIRSEGKYPTSSVQDLWPFLQVQIDYGITPEKGNGSGGGIMGHGEEWRRIRSFMQTDLLAPKSANRYLPGILQATRYCSRGLPHHKTNVNHFLQLASFDMFCSVLVRTGFQKKKTHFIALLFWLCRKEKEPHIYLFSLFLVLFVSS
jgi:hypothetical protein